MGNQSKSYKIAIYVFAIVWSIVTLYPLFVTFMSSLKNNEEIFGSMFSLPSSPVWQNYVDSITGAKILNSVKNSLILAVSTTSIVLLVAIPASFILARKSYKFVGLAYLLFLTGLLLPIHSTIIPISQLARFFQANDSYIFLVLIYSTFQLPQAIFLITGYIKGISTELDEAATIDGCGSFRLLLNVIAPVSMPIISTVGILAFIYGYSELIFSINLLSSPAKYPISRALLYFTGDFSVRMGPVFSSIILAVMPMVVIYLLFHERVQKGMLAGAVKG